MPLPEGAIPLDPPQTDLPEQPVAQPQTSLPPGAVPISEDQGFGTAKFVDRLARMIAQGVTFNHADEFAAFMRSQTEDIGFDQALAEERGKDIKFEDRFPVTAMGGKIAGAIVSPVSKVAAPAKGAALLPQMGRGAVAGAGLGALAGAGAGENTEGRVRGAIVGGAVGGVTGLATPPAIVIAGTTLRQLGRVVTRTTGEAFKGARKVLRALQDDEIGAQEAVKRLRELGPEAGLADVGEENVRGVARAVASMPGPARTKAHDFFETRQLAQGDRVVEKVRSAFGEFRKFATSADDLMGARAAAATPRYKEAYSREIPFTDELADILQTDAGKRAFAFARRIASNEGRKLPEILRVADDGTVRLDVEAVPDMRSWDIIKRAFDTVLNRRRNAVTNKLDLSDPLNFSINEVRARLVNELDRLNPAYKTARAIFAGPASSLNAMQRGRAFLKGDVDLTVKAIKGMTPADRDFFRLGVVRGIQDVVEGTRDITDVTGRLFGAKAMRDKLRAVFPDDVTFKQFQDFMEAEAEMALTRRVVLGGSPTARIQAEQADLFHTAGTVGEFMFGNPVLALRNAIKELGGRIPPEQSKRLGDLLFTKGEEVNEEALRKLFRFERLEGVPHDVQQQLVRVLVTSGAISSAEMLQ